MAAVNHFAEVAGLSENARAGLVAAFEDALHEVFSDHSKDHNSVRMSIAAPTGKIEASLQIHGERSNSDKGERIRKVFAGKLDTVALESSGDDIQLKLVKNLSPVRKKR